MSIVMSTMAKQQASPGAFKLDAICEKLKKTSEDGNDDDVDDSLEMHPYNLSDNNNGGHGGLYHHHHSHGHSGILPNGSGGEDDDDDDDDECMDEGPLMSSSPHQSCYPSNSHEALYGDDSNSNSEVANYSIGGDAMSMRSDDTSMNDSEAKELVYEPSTPTEGGVTFGGGGRRNKRKNFKPRNIVYQYETCEDALEGESIADDYSSSQQRLHRHSHHEDFHDASDDGNEIDQPSSSSAKHPHQGNCRSSGKNHEQPLDLSGDAGCLPSHKSSHMPAQQRHLDNAGAMDLSVRHSDSEDEGHNGMAMDLSKSKVSSAEAESSCSSSDDVLTTSATTLSASDPPTSATATIGTSIVPSSSSSPGANVGGTIEAKANRASPTSVVMSSRSALGLQREAAMKVGSLSPGACTTLHGMPSTSTDASAMKDYAESTMKELLGLYGFNDMAESITKSVPLDNFYSGKILETMSPRLFGASPASLGLCPPTSVASSSPSGLQVTSTQRTPSPQHQPSLQQPPQHQHPSPHQSQQQHHPSHPPHHHHHHHHHHHSPAVSHPSTPSALHPHHREGIYDSLCNKVVDSMAKLASLPPNSIIGNPRVILPPNMTTTILTLAMQDTKFAAAAMAAAASNSQSKPPVLEPMSQPPIVSPQPSVIVSSSSSPLNVPLPKDPISKAGHIDYTRYVKRYANATECGSNYCKDLNYREHFHCMDCNSRVFVKKEEMIRHFKWHKKRDESLQHGFLRFSPMDDCSDKFQNCSHNRKQTHYHCLKEGCDKVYISTSDVQMHANYHRKDSAIIQEGFQRFRATEDCSVSSCTFFGQRTTHFHCRRPNCNYTFKNKADMEKHKTYHIKDEQLNRDGFKKFMKHENCPFESCRFSRVCNHIHCIRAGCSYVLHSSGQLYSHKRKHERSENEMAYRKFKLAQSMLKTFSENQSLILPGQMSEECNSSESTSSGIQTSNAVPVIQSSTNPVATTSSTGSLSTLAGTAPSTASASSFSINNSNNHHHPNYQQYLSYHSLDQQSLSQLASLLTGVNLNTPIGLPLSLLPPGSKPLTEQLLANQLASVTGMPTPEHLAAMDLTSEMLKPKPDDSWKRYLTRYTANDPCKANCDFLYKDHYHCTAENCHMMFRSKDGVREHARTHEQQDQVTEAFYTTVEAGHPVTCPSDCPYQNKEKHYHCCWESCREIILPSDKAFRRLDHYKMHDYSRKLNTGKDPLSMTLTTSVDGMFKRKRGRPPKNRVIEVWPQFPMPSSPSDLPQAIFTSFKLPKPSTALGLSTAVPCTTAAHSLLDKHGTPISAVATPYGLVPTAMLTARPGGSPAVTTAMATPLTMSMLNQMAPSPMQQKAFSTYLRLQPHLQKHAGTTSPISSAQGGSGHSTGADDDSAEGGDEGEQDDREQDEDEGESSTTPRQPHVSLPAPSEFLSNLHASLYSNAVGEAPPLFFPQPRSLAAMPPGCHSLLSHAQAMARSEERRSPQQNGSNNTEFEAQQSPHDSAYSNSGKASPNQDENLDSNPASPQWMGSSSRKRSISTSPRNEDYSDAKRSRVSSSMASLRILKDEPVPEGYIRYRFNEDCHYTHCGYREHQTHFHCIRHDCGYSFCDKTRFVQHTARHERLDTLMGGDFQQFRANIPCGRPDCLYTITMSATGSAGNKASHFHCLKCDFVCTDTNKVVAHRRQHQKLDSIMAAGFEKFTPTQNCQMEGCSHNQKQTHYHCVKCQYAVLGLSQMSAHKYRHLE